MFNLFFLVKDLEKLDLNKTFSNMNNIVIYVLLIVFAIGLIRSLTNGFNVLNFVLYIICSALAIYLILNSSQLESIGEICFNTLISALKSIPHFELSNTNNESNQLFIIWRGF